MCFYCKAASTILDMLWEETDMRDYFHDQGVDLSGLGPLTHEVFVPAYRTVKDTLDRNALALLEAQVTQDMLEPYYDKPGFRQVWDEWDTASREEFARETSELELARLLYNFYAEDFAAAYEDAYRTHSEGLARSS